MKALSNRISIPAILEVGTNTIDSLGELLNREGLDNVVLFYGEGIYELVGDKIESSIKAASASNKINVLGTSIISTIDFESIAEQAFNIPQSTEVIIGIGGGKVLDCAKYMSFLRKLPYISIPTSTSNDGFSSPVSSLMVKGKRTSVPAKIPYGIVVDINIIKGSPDKFIYSGVGDLLSNITALFDWKFEAQNKKGSIDDFAVMISKKAVNSFVRTEFETIKDDLFLKELVDSLILNGIAMEIAGNSSPASGSEHLISHALDKILDTPQLHGIQVGLATYIMSKIQNHRLSRITSILTKTGFFEYAKTLNLKAEDYVRAIDVAPSIKPQRYTYIHIEEYREKAKELIYSDEILKSILL